MANRKGLKESEIKASKSYSMDEFMGAYLRGELELKPDGKVKAAATANGRPRWLLVPANLRDIPEDMDISDCYKWFQHQDRKGNKYHIFGLKRNEWKKKGYEGKLVKRYVSEIENELSQTQQEDETFNAEFEQEMLEWAAGDDKR